MEATSGGPRAKRGHHPRQVLMSVSIGVAIALILVFMISPIRDGLTERPALDGGLTFQKANLAAADLIANATGSPWRLVSAQGIASTGPFLPDPATYPPDACQDLPGPTPWNASRIVAWGAVQGPGTAALWTLMFVNASGFVLPVLVTASSNATTAPIGPNSRCGEAMSTLDGGLPLSDADTISPQFDSSVAGSIAWGAVGEEFIENHPEMAVTYSFGPSPTSGIEWGSAWSVFYSVCGLTGFGGNGSFAWAGIVNSSGPPQTTGSGSQSCTLTDYTITLLPTTSTSEYDGGTLLSFPVNVSDLSPPITVYSADSLSSWILSLSLLNYSNHVLSSAGVLDCPGSNFSVGTCGLTQPGWFAALATAAGYWLDVYDRQGSGNGWVLPNVGVYTNDTLLVYVPSTQGSGELTLTFNSSDASVALSGSQSFFN